MRRTITLALLAAAMAMLLASGVALAADIICKGGSDPCLGTNETDDMVGTNRAEVIKALADDDTLDGLDGDDTLHGGRGREVYLGRIGDGIEGGNGDDTYFGGPGGDSLTDLDRSGRNGCTGESMPAPACTGRDTMHGGEGMDDLDGAIGPDFLHGGKGWDALFAGPGNDVLRGGGFHDLVVGEQGSDRMMGQGGDDTMDGVFFESPGTPDTISCGTGRDEVIASRNDVVRADCERVDRRLSTTVPPTSEDRDSLREKAREEFLAKNKPSG
jgi:Ca2+-binding RTX toxin-like protein